MDRENAEVTSKVSVEGRTKGSSPEEKKRLAGLKSRQKKKRYVQSLQDNVKLLCCQLQKHNGDISKCKDQLMQAIRMANHHYNEHSYTFAELQRNTLSEDPDIDHINFLLDLLQSRIGANGKERQAKLDYNFKQIINCMFPAAHRYFMYSAAYSKDLFQYTPSPQRLIAQLQDKWTHTLYRQIRLSDGQINKMNQFKQRLVSYRKDATAHICRLKRIKSQVKLQEDIFQLWMSDVREQMSPIQSAILTIFGQKNKLRRQFQLGEGLIQAGPLKRLKIQD